MNNVKKSTLDSPKNFWLQNLGAYLCIFIASLLFLKPIAFDNKAFRQHDNQQALAMQQEIRTHLEEDGEFIKWTNQNFVGMPTHLLLNNNNPNVLKHSISIGTFTYSKGEIRSLFMLMIGVFLGLSLLGLNTLSSLMLALTFGFFTSNILYISAGHTGKIHVLASVPVILAAFVFAWRKNILLGSSIFAFAFSLNILRNHIQITYYMAFALVFLGLAFLIEAIKEQKLPQFGKFVAGIGLASILGLTSNLGLLWPNYEYSAESSRGKSELKKKGHSEGLSSDYVFGMSFEKAESMSLMFPNFYGGSQGEFWIDVRGTGEVKGTKTEALWDNNVSKQLAKLHADKKLAAKGISRGSYLSQYRGSQTIVGGPLYMGAVICSLIFFALFFVRGPIKWAFLGTFFFYLMLAWGKHFPMFNDFMYEHFPLYNKFRDTKMTLFTMQPMLLLFIALGLKSLIEFKVEDYEKTVGAKFLAAIKKELNATNYVLLGMGTSLLVAILVFLYGMFGSPSSHIDQYIAEELPDLLYCLQQDRAALIRTDAIRAIIFIALTTAPLYFFTKKNIKIEVAITLISVLAMVDFHQVNSNYINEMSYVEKEEQFEINPLPVDNTIIKQGKGAHYRVVDYIRNGQPSQNATASKFHKSFGGYFAAKPLLYQEFANYYGLDSRDQNMIQQNLGIMGMFNVKYYILDQKKVADNPSALGNCWLVNEVKEVADADAELAAVGQLTLHREAVVQSKHKDYVKGLSQSETAGDYITLANYHPDVMTYKSKTAKERFAVFSEMYYPPSKGWNVYIDGEKVEGFVKTNYLLRGLRIPAGEHEIKMVFEPSSAAIGSTSSLISSLLILLALIGSVYLYQKKK